MVVAYSRRIAAELTGLLQERLDEQAVTCVISAQATDEPGISHFRRSKAQRQQIAKRFRDPDDPLRVVVVKDMWLTGFDAPVLHTLYIDKPMRDHGLLQAIARVNRVFEGKFGGLVVDYIGIGEDLRASLRAYDANELEEPAVPVAKAIAGLWGQYEVLCALLYPVGYRQGELDQALDPQRLFSDAYDHILAGEERTREFLDAQKTLGSFYALVSTQPAVIPLREEIRFFKKLAAAVRAITTPDAQASPQAEQAIRQFMSEGLAAGDIVETLQIAEQDRPDISVLSDEFLDSLAAKTEHPNVQIRLLEKLLKGEIKSSTRTNQTQAKIFGEQIGLRYERADPSARCQRLVRSQEPARRSRRTSSRLTRTRRLLRRAAGRDAHRPLRPRTRQEHPRRPHRRLGRPRVQRGRHPPQDQTPTAPAPLPTRHRNGWRRRRGALRRQPLHAARARAGEGALPLLAGCRGAAV